MVILIYTYGYYGHYFPYQKIFNDWFGWIIDENGHVIFYLDENYNLIEEYEDD